MMLIAGIGLLVFALRSLRALTGALGNSATRRHWKIVRGLVWLFLTSYLLVLYMVFQSPISNDKTSVDDTKTHQSNGHVYEPRGADGVATDSERFGVGTK